MNAVEEIKYGCHKPYNPNCQTLSNDINDCRRAGGGSMYDCVQMAGDKYVRSKDENKDQIYPWKNYDWDYTRFIDNNYNARATGATSAGTMGAIFSNPRAIFRLGKGFLTDNNPNNSSQAGQSDLTQCDRVPVNDRRSCQVMNRIRGEYNNQQKPRNDPFFNKKINGKNSSSFYYKSGYCKMALTQDQCKNKKYLWIGEKCYKTQYQYLNNEPWGGNIPSVINDALSLNPVNLTKVFFNKNARDLEIEECRPVIENFVESSDIISYFHISMAILLLITIILLLLYIGKLHFL
jgi:hypothetical protein